MDFSQGENLQVYLFSPDHTAHGPALHHGQVGSVAALDTNNNHNNVLLDWFWLELFKKMRIMRNKIPKLSYSTPFYSYLCIMI